MKTRVLDFDVVIAKDPDGGYYAYVPRLPGCYSQGETVEETLENIKEAIELYLETLSDEEREEIISDLPNAILLTKVEINT
ncbi:MAG: type II toxin-antitoxin system HicB family antitoxin [Candidatus Diapherotrites archaeon]|nr:type II toxin-antitoxin system HicB family antitoxin [Candidatus Diapherotrites archaeon]